VATEVFFESSDRYKQMSPQQRRFKLHRWPVEVENGEKPSQIAILVNGFLEGVKPGEGENRLTFLRYEKIAKALNSENIAAVFLPLPFHFDRCGEAAADGTCQAIVQLKKMAPICITAATTRSKMTSNSSSVTFAWILTSMT
jgi:hypothetical protein